MSLVPPQATIHNSVDTVLLPTAAATTKSIADRRWFSAALSLSLARSHSSRECDAEIESVRASAAERAALI